MMTGFRVWGLGCNGSGSHNEAVKEGTFCLYNRSLLPLGLGLRL